MPKRSIIIALFVFSALLSLVALSSVTSAATPILVGTWRGSLKGPQSMPLVLRITAVQSATNPQTFSAVIDSPSQNVVGSLVSNGKFFPLVLGGRIGFTVNNAQIHGASFQGLVQDNCMNGVWSQNGLVLPLSLCVVPSSRPLTDIAPFPSAVPAINRIVAQGIMTPIRPGIFNPTGGVNRGDFAVMLQRMFNLTPPRGARTFVDVPKSDPRFSAILAAAPYMNRQVFCFGCMLSNRFSPNVALTRAESTVMIVRLLGSQGRVRALSAADFKSAIATIPDGRSSGALIAPYLAIAVREGVVPFGPDRLLHPLGPLTRAYTAVYLDRVQQVKKIQIRVIPMTPVVHPIPLNTSRPGGRSRKGGA